MSAVLEGGAFTGGNRQVEPSLRGRDPCRASDSLRCAPALLGLVCILDSPSPASQSLQVELRESDGREIDRKGCRRGHGSSLGR